MFSVIRDLYHDSEIRGYPEADIQQAAARLGGLPAVLAAYYRQLGAADAGHSTGDYLCSPARLTRKEGFLFFYAAELEDIWWTLREEDLQMENPPVYARVWQDTGYRYLLESETLEQFLYAMAYSRAVHLLPFHSEGDFRCDAAQKARIEARYQKKPFGFAATPRTLFFGNDPDEAIRICVGDRSMQAAYGCTTEDQLRRIENVIFGETEDTEWT